MERADLNALFAIGIIERLDVMKKARWFQRAFEDVDATLRDHLKSLLVVGRTILSPPGVDLRAHRSGALTPLMRARIPVLVPSPTREAKDNAPYL